MKKNSRKACIGLLVVLALIAAVFLSGALDRRMIWTNEGAQGLTLPAGTYGLAWTLDGENAEAIVLTTENSAPVSPARIEPQTGETSGYTQFVLEDAAQGLRFMQEGSDDAPTDAASLWLQSPVYRDHAFTFAFALLGAYALWLLHACGLLPPQCRGRLILIGLAVLIACGPAMKDTITLGHDTVFHMVRLCNLADGLSLGQLPVRAGGYAFNGYGAITPAFYPDLFLYGPALLMNAGASLQYAVNAFLIAVNAASALTMYAATKRIFKKEEGETGEWTAVCASILYTLCIYRISDVYTRCAVGEMTAMVFLPLFLLGLYEVVLGDKRRWLTLALSAAGIYLSHMLSTLICALTAMFVCALYIRRILRERRLGAIVKAACAAGLLCAFQLAPFITYSLQGIGAAELAKDPVDFALAPAQLFLLGAGEAGVDPLDPGFSTFSLEIGLPLLLSSALALYMAAAKERSGKNDRFALLLIAAGAAFAWMATTMFPWSTVRTLTRGYSNYLQFPWRFLMMTAVLLCLAGGYGCAQFARSHGEKMAAALLAVAALCALPTLSSEARRNTYIGFAETATPNWQYTEYTLPGTKTLPTLDRSIHTTGSVAITDYQKDSLSITLTADAQTDADVALPVFAYDGFAAEINGQEAVWTVGEDNRLTVHLPAGTQGELRVWFAGKPLWRIAEGVSLLTAMALAAHTLMDRKKKEARR